MRQRTLTRGFVFLAAFFSLACGGDDAVEGPAGKSAAPSTLASQATSEETGVGSARFLREVEWAEHGIWLKVDTHTHSDFSDGGNTVAEVATKAVGFGCDAIAITDHADGGSESASDAYWSAIQAAREEHPDLLILGGLEWDIPPHRGSEHIIVLAPPATERRLAEFKSSFDGPGGGKLGAKDARRGLRWLKEQGAAPATGAAKGSILPVAIYSHPSRKDSRSLDNVDDVKEWRRENDVLVSFGGAPGHQRHKHTGSYTYDLHTVDRWDPVVEIGDAWDVLLQDGVDIWAALAPSDYHTASYREMLDPWPGEFAETWLYAPDRSADGVLRALRAGSFFAAHGHIAREVVLSVEAEGLARRAISGEMIELADGAEIHVRLQLELPANDWQGEANRVDEIEFIAIDHNGARSLARHRAPFADDGVTETLSLNDGDLVLRARGRRIVEEGPDLLFYTNPIRIRAR